MRTRVAIGGLVSTLVLGLAGGAWWGGLFEASPSDTMSPSHGSSNVDRRTVLVARGDIEVVVALEATTVPSPSFVLEAPVEGSVETASWFSHGDDFPEGETIFRVGGRGVATSVSARIDEWLVPDGGWVAAGLPVVRLTFSGFGLVGSMPPSDAYRLLDGGLSATGRIEGGPSGFECPILRAPSTASGGADGSDAGPGDVSGGPVVVCAIPSSLRAYADVRGQIALRSGQVSDVLTLPVTAVSGSADMGEVWVVDDEGEATIRQVRLGATDGARVEIVSGLEEGARVYAVPPPLVR